MNEFSRSINHPERQRVYEASRFGDMSKAFAGFRRQVEAIILPHEQEATNNTITSIANEFELVAQIWFPTELGWFKKDGQTTIGSRYKDAELEYRRTLSSMLGVVILTPSSTEALARDESDPKYTMFTQRQKGDRLSVDHFRSYQEQMKTACPDDEHLGVLMSILAMHDLAKLRTVAETIEQKSGIHTINHDILLAQMDRIPALYEELAPGFARLPDKFKEKARRVMDTPFNRGQLAQAECTPVQLASVRQEKVDDNTVALIRAENTADLSGLTGDLGTLMTENMFTLYKTADDAVDLLRAGATETEAYAFLLQKRLDHAGIQTMTVRPEDFETDEGRENIALARIACMVKANADSFPIIEHAYGRLGNKPQKQLKELLGRSGMDGRFGIMFYYLPALLETIVRQENDRDQEKGAEFGMEKGMRLAAHLGKLADAYLQDTGFNTQTPSFIKQTDDESIPFQEVGIRGITNPQDATEFVFGLDRVVKMLQDDYSAFSVPDNPLEAFFDIPQSN